MSKKKVRWGVKWGVLGSGAGMLMIGGGIALVLWLLTGFIYVWFVAIGCLGFLIMLIGLIGLMGEQGIW